MKQCFTVMHLFFSGAVEIYIALCIVALNFNPNTFISIQSLIGTEKNLSVSYTRALALLDHTNKVKLYEFTLSIVCLD